MADTTESHPVAKLQQESRDRKRHRLRSRVIVVRNCTFVLGPAGPALRAERSHDILLEGTHGGIAQGRQLLEETIPPDSRMTMPIVAAHGGPSGSAGESHEGRFPAGKTSESAQSPPEQLSLRGLVSLDKLPHPKPKVTRFSSGGRHTVTLGAPSTSPPPTVAPPPAGRKRGLEFGPLFGARTASFSDLFGDARRGPSPVFC
ncbi:hypothetical protein Plec18167_008073 [Paecilomyces lecythidis]|uniref:Uncharacterized protein n=1 Tax=Paecilomyces lecythidis TaxID=3004212 RepID=A0ABR3WZ80_9EURO